MMTDQVGELIAVVLVGFALVGALIVLLFVSWRGFVMFTAVSFFLAHALKDSYPTVSAVFAWTLLGTYAVVGFCAVACWLIYAVVAVVVFVSDVRERKRAATR